MQRFWFHIPVLLLLMFALGGCNTLGKKKDKESAEAAPKDKGTWYLTFIEFEKYRTEHNEMGELEYGEGRFIYLKPFPLLTSAHIVKVEPYAVAGGMGLRCHLDREGSTIWTQLSGTYRGDTIALFIDGRFRAFLKVPNYATGTTFELTGPFTDEEASRIAAEASKNYGNERFKDKKKDKKDKDK